MTISQELAEVWDEAEARRGRRWAYPELEARRVALVGVGLTRGLMEHAPRPQGALARLGALAETMRLVGGRVIWSRPDDHPAPPGLGMAQGAARATGLQNEFAPEAPRQEGDMNFRIRPPSLFYPGASHAPHLLRGMGVDTLIFAGGLTHLEVESSVRDAVCAGFQCVVAADSCLDRTPEAHVSALRSMHRSFADVRPTQEIVTLLRRNFGLNLSDVEEAAEEAMLALAASPAISPGLADLIPDFAPNFGAANPKAAVLAETPAPAMDEKPSKAYIPHSLPAEGETSKP